MMVDRKHETIYNSTFNEDITNPATKHMWRCNSESTISSIKDIFNSSEIKEIVESLVMSKFGTRHNTQILKSISRHSQRQSASSSSGNNFESTESSSRVNISKKKSGSSTKRSNMSECVSKNVPSSTMFDAKSVDDAQCCLGTRTRTRSNNFERTESSTISDSDTSKLLSNVLSSTTFEAFNDALRYSDTSTPLETENISLIRENSSESDGLESVSAITMVGDSNLSLKLLNKKKLILYQTKEQILKAIHYHEMSHSRLTLHTERLEAEKLLLMTDAKLNSVFYETEESTSVEDINSFCSGTLLISNMHLFPEQFCDQHFVCLITFDTKVFVNEISKMKSNGVIYFDKKFTISGLQPNFKLRLKVYCASPKVLKKSIISQVVCNYPDDRLEDDVPFRTSIFSLWGEADIELLHLSQSPFLQIQMDFGLFTACISSQANVDINILGFMNVSKTSNTYPSWDRQFCSFGKGLLNFYNYSQNGRDQLTPTTVLNLEDCELIFPSRENCSRKYSICLKNPNGGILMSFDTQDEFECWSKYLSIALLHIRTWNKC